MQTILIIGSNSFSGATFADFALQQGARVLGISRSHEPIDAFLPYKWHDHANFKFYPLDLNKHLAEINALMQEVKPAYVVNFAAQSMVGESWYNPGDWFITNVVSTIKFHDELRKCDFLKRYVHVSTPSSFIELSPALFCLFCLARNCSCTAEASPLGPLSICAMCAMPPTRLCKTARTGTHITFRLARWFPSVPWLSVFAANSKSSLKIMSNWLANAWVRIPHTTSIAPKRARNSAGKTTFRWSRA
jgi:hypothetical protein